MRYPKLLKKGSLIGITALSSGASDCRDKFDLAIENLRKVFSVILTDNVYGSNIVSSSTSERVEQLNDLLDTEGVGLILTARGGNYLYETLDSIDFDKIYEKNIWFEGASDATSLLYILTTKYDIATIYGRNAKQFSQLSDDVIDNINLIKNEGYVQEDYYDRDILSVNGNFNASGIAIGGCLDVIKDIIGTKFDNTKEFIEKYKKYGVIWYFDIFSMSSIDVYLTLLQFKNAGWFKYSDTFIFGTVAYPAVLADLSYEEAIEKAMFGYDNIIINANIGHIKPVNTIINGSRIKMEFKDGNYILKQEFID